jgi:hypothetical protein
MTVGTRPPTALLFEEKSRRAWSGLRFAETSPCGPDTPYPSPAGSIFAA